MPKKKEIALPPFEFPAELYTEMEANDTEGEPPFAVTWQDLAEFKDGTFVGVYKLASIKRVHVRPALKELK